MKTKPVYQYDVAGLFVGQTDADESPLEPGVFLIPARCVEVAPPEFSGDQWPRWNGAKWELISVSPANDNQPASPVDKLREFLNANPDVAALIGATNEATNV
ncbi:hypothetical protein ep3_0043 [Escherichia phage vB_EcoM-ep3]|uniref:Phage tail protein n=2 Tax=Jilinvirus TaxID=1918725 RepID=A0A088FV63_9CAUD|nr:tail fiber protein [Escherichia phage vB_EcoM-ep3]YP_009600713.1 tail fiber protein [Escherichia phage vB_EcoM_ECOO78]AIM50569.1 hypothetical protein ep3_0043 [Escherichia phage vB_EcoM-ep3]ARM70445.1 hypothetical protein vBEcoMECOO78_40 [Escherichia phage vB_EcoM_ECOO78]